MLKKFINRTVYQDIQCSDIHIKIWYYYEKYFQRIPENITHIIFVFNFNEP